MSAEDIVLIPAESFKIRGIVCGQQKQATRKYLNGIARRDKFAAAQQKAPSNGCMQITNVLEASR